MATKGSSFSPEQVLALVDLLSHHAIYEEISQFKSPGTIKEYGPPFQDTNKTTSPILQTLLSKFALTLPGLRDVSDDFWKVRVQSLIEELAAAELSESYDKGLLGVRKTLATATSALLEYPARGCLGGFHKDDTAFTQRTFDVTKPDDVLQAWHDFLQQLVYGDLFDKLFAKVVETDDLEKHDSLVRAAHEYVILNLASFMHYTLVLSPEGPSLLRLIENVHKLYVSQQLVMQENVLLTRNQCTLWLDETDASHRKRCHHDQRDDEVDACKGERCFHHELDRHQQWSG